MCTSLCRAACIFDCMFSVNSLERQCILVQVPLLLGSAKCARLKQVALLFVARLRQVLARRYPRDFERLGPRPIELAERK